MVYNSSISFSEPLAINAILALGFDNVLIFRGFPSFPTISPPSSLKIQVAAAISQALTSVCHVAALKSLGLFSLPRAVFNMSKDIGPIITRS